jgi:hypothetical protein
MSSFASAGDNGDGTLDLNLFVQAHEIIGHNNPDTWSAFPMLPPFICEVLDTIISPAAYAALHFHPDSFRRILAIDRMCFEQIPIFRFDGDSFQQVELQRGDYAAAFEQALGVVARNRAIIEAAAPGSTPDIGSIRHMAFAISAGAECDAAGVERMKVRGFYPYFCTSVDRLQEHVFLFFHSRLDQVAMVVSSSPEQAVQFLLETGSIQAFDKLCAWCGMTGRLRKCSCMAVRYCGRECQRRHWVSHADECRAERARLAGGI